MLEYTKSFLQVSSSKSILIIDYPNIIHILFEKYKDKNQVIKHFYHFIYSELERKTNIIIITKNVTIDDNTFDIETVLNIGAQITQKQIDRSYFDKESIQIYHLSYSNPHRISSSIDDLLGYFICFVLFAYLTHSGIQPSQRLKMITNDKQFFDKNLFGKTQD